jgi:hypothetical protein
MPSPVDIDFENLGLCSYGQGTSDDPAKRDPDACPEQGTNVTEEGYVYCGEHVKWFYAAVAAIEGK